MVVNNFMSVSLFKSDVERLCMVHGMAVQNKCLIHYDTYTLKVSRTL